MSHRSTAVLAAGKHSPQRRLAVEALVLALFEGRAPLEVLVPFAESGLVALNR